MKRALGVVLVAMLAGSALLTHAQEQAPDARAKLAQVLAEQKVSSNFDAGWVAIPCDVVVRGDLLEYLLVNERGAAHESLLGTTVVPSVLNTALLALGLSPGTNARWVAKQGADAAPGAFEVLPPEGAGLYLHVAWRRGEEVHFHRLEDLVLDRSTGAAMRRQKFVYLGSRMVTVRAEEAPVYAADVEGNLVNVSFFEAGHTVLTTSAPECVRQTVWLPNGWLLPQTGQAVQLIFARNRLSSLPDELLTQIPDLGPLPAER
jgi:hypothetical protein